MSSANMQNISFIRKCAARGAGKAKRMNLLNRPGEIRVNLESVEVAHDKQGRVFQRFPTG